MAEASPLKDSTKKAGLMFSSTWLKGIFVVTRGSHGGMSIYPWHELKCLENHHHFLLRDHQDSELVFELRPKAEQEIEPAPESGKSQPGHAHDIWVLHSTLKVPVHVECRAYVLKGIDG
ncbi:hypothetical protein GN956_G18366 [Arapaima gigas]